MLPLEFTFVGVELSSSSFSLIFGSGLEFGVSGFRVYRPYGRLSAYDQKELRFEGSLQRVV